MKRHGLKENINTISFDNNINEIILKNSYISLYFFSFPKVSQYKQIVEGKLKEIQTSKTLCKIYFL